VDKGDLVGEIEIFSHDLSVRGDETAPGVYIISGKDWENKSFNLYINEEDARNILWQLSFFVDDPSRARDDYSCNFCGLGVGDCNCGTFL
jgi:hypothetical protein